MPIKSTKHMTLDKKFAMNQTKMVRTKDNNSARLSLNS